MNIVASEHEQGGDEQPELHRAFVVERPRREVGADHAGTASGLRLAQQEPDERRERVQKRRRRRDAIGQRRSRARIDGVDGRGEPLLETAPHLIDVGGVADARAAGQQHAREAAAAQPILVVHRGLMDEIGQRAVGVGRAVAEEDQVRSAQRSRATP